MVGIMAVEKSQPSQSSFIGSFNRKKKMPVDSENAGLVDEGGRSLAENDANNTRGAADGIPEIDECSDPLEGVAQVDDLEGPAALDAEEKGTGILKAKPLDEGQTQRSFVNFDETPILGAVSNSPLAIKNDKLGKIEYSRAGSEFRLTDEKMKVCPYCNRRFNEKAAERHIPICENTRNRAKPPPSKSELMQK